MSSLKVGSIVNITGYLHKLKYENHTRLVSLPLYTVRRALVLGTSMRHEGKLESDDEGWHYMTLRTDSQHVWMVMPLMGNRYRTPIAVLPEHIKDTGDSNE